MRLGIDLGEIPQLLHVYPLKNREYVCTQDGKMTANKNWATNPLTIAPITIVQNLTVFEKDMEQFKQIQDVYVKDSTIFMLNKGYYGCQATVTSTTVQNGRIKCMWNELYPPHLHHDFFSNLSYSLFV